MKTQVDVYLPWSITTNRSNLLTQQCTTQMLNTHSLLILKFLKCFISQLFVQRTLIK